MAAWEGSETETTKIKICSMVQHAQQEGVIHRQGPLEVSLDVTQLQSQHSEGLRAMEHMQLLSLELEQQEMLARMAVVEEQWSSAVAVSAGLSLAAARLQEMQSAAQASREHVATLEEALEESQLSLDQMGRELEAMRDAQAALDAEGQQRQLWRSEGDRRTGLVREQRAAFGVLQEMERVSRLAVAQQAVERLQQAEALARLAIAQEQASGLDLASVVQQLQALVTDQAEALSALAVAQAQAHEAEPLVSEEPAAQDVAAPVQLEVAPGSSMEAAMDRLASEEAAARKELSFSEQVEMVRDAFGLYSPGPSCLVASPSVLGPGTGHPCLFDPWQPLCCG